MFPSVVLLSSMLDQGQVNGLAYNICLMSICLFVGRKYNKINKKILTRQYYNKFWNHNAAILPFFLTFLWYKNGTTASHKIVRHSFCPFPHIILLYYLILFYSCYMHRFAVLQFYSKITVLRFTTFYSIDAWQQYYKMS